MSAAPDLSAAPDVPPMGLPRAPDLPAVDVTASGWAGRLLTRLGAGLDDALLFALRHIVDAALVPPPEDLPRLHALAVEHLERVARHPGGFFAFMDDPAPRPSLTARFRRALPGGAVIARRLTVPYEHFCPRAAEDAHAFPETGRVLVEHWMHHPARPAATVVALHAFTLGQPRMNAIALMASEWYRRGLDVALLTLPFHGPRSPRGARFSGARFMSPDVARMNDAVRQAIFEIRVVSDWLRAESGAPVGLIGLSLGGYLAALTAGLSPAPDFVVPMLPPVCLGDLAWRLFADSRRYRDRPLPLERDELRLVLGIHSPLAYPLRVARERVLIVAGRGDRIAPPEHAHALWRHWGEPAILWFSGSHLAPFRRRPIVAAVADHLARLGILPAS